MNLIEYLKIVLNLEEDRELQLVDEEPAFHFTLEDGEGRG